MVIGLSLGVGAVIAGIIGLAGIRIIDQTNKGLIQTLGKFSRLAEPGFHWIVPIFQTMEHINMTETQYDLQPQVVITKDKLNVLIDAMVFATVADAYKAKFKVNNYQQQLVSLAQTTLRHAVSKMSLTEANEKRDEINKDIAEALDKVTHTYGVDVLRVEIQDIKPPKDVQEIMNEVVKAEQEKIRNRDLAEAREIEADGYKKAEIKKAEGDRQRDILKSESEKTAQTNVAEGKASAIKIVAEARADAIKFVNEAASKYFVGGAVQLKRLEVTEASLKDNAKLIITQDGISPTLILSEADGVIPLKSRGVKA